VSWNLGKQAINPSRKVFRKAWANIIPGFFEPRRLDVLRHISRIGAPVCIWHEPQFVMMKIGLGMQKKLNMAPILKLAIPIGQFRSTLKLGQSIRVLCPEYRDAENELGNGVAGLGTRDSGIAADLNRQVDKRYHDANRSDDLSEIREVAKIHTLPNFLDRINRITGFGSEG
jgi:hypothetical protein